MTAPAVIEQRWLNEQPDPSHEPGRARGRPVFKKHEPSAMPAARGGQGTSVRYSPLDLLQMRPRQEESELVDQAVLAEHSNTTAEEQLSSVLAEQSSNVSAESSISPATEVAARIQHDDPSDDSSEVSPKNTNGKNRLRP